MRLRLILDDGTPACLPKWAEDEIVQSRLAIFALKCKLAQYEGAWPMTDPSAKVGSR